MRKIKPDPYESDAFPRPLVIWGIPAMILIPLIIMFFRNPGTDGLIPCVFFQATGIYCVGCGTTRALHALLHGRFLDAFSYNIFLILWMWIPAYSLIEYWLKRLFRKPVLPPIRRWRVILIIMFLSALIFLVLRNIPIQPFSWLAP